jgi:GT2 family glycosyltransferase
MRIAAVVVNWNQAELTGQCVRSLRDGSSPPRWIIVVDNGSGADPTACVRTACPEAMVIRNSSNCGFAAGANRGIEHAMGLGAEGILVVNNDAVVATDCVMALVAALEDDDRLAAVGAKTLTQEQPPRIHTAYGMLTYHGQLVRQQGWLEPDVTQFNELVHVDYISGCAMLLRRAALERVGLLDVEFFAYHEDLDWCMRARRAGYRVAYVPAGIVYHRMHASTGGGGYLSPITYLSARNAILFVRKHASWMQRLTYAFYLCGNLLKEVVFRGRRGELAGFTLRLRGLRDGLLRRPVPLREIGLDGEPRATPPPPADAAGVRQTERRLRG